MTESDWIKVGLTVLTGLLTVLWWFLQQKDAQQEKELSQLWLKYDTLKEQFQKHQIDVIDNHYKKPELDNKFDKLERDIKDGFDGLGKKFDELSKSLLNHIAIEDRRKTPRE